MHLLGFKNGEQKRGDRSYSLTYRHASTMKRGGGVLKAALVISVVYHSRKHCGKLEVLFCGLIIETTAPSFAETNEKQRASYKLIEVVNLEG